MPLRRVLTAVTLVVAAVPLAAREAPARSPHNASYQIAARLDPVNHLILGHEHLIWRNTSQVAASELRFHMYWNAWRDVSSTWAHERMRAQGSALDGRPPEDLALIDITALTLTGAGAGADLLPRAHYVAPDDGNADDRTVLAVPLDQPIAPGSTADIDITWNAHAPRAFGRTGVLGDTFVISAWFPKIGVLEDAGWNCRQFHFGTEFFADFGDYDVSLTVPAGWIVGATGAEQSKTPGADGSVTHRYVERDIHDFAWTTSPRYIDVRARVEQSGLPPVDVRLLLQPEHRAHADRYLDAARTTLAAYAASLGPFPYGHLTIVDPVETFSPAQGVSPSGASYPTLIVVGDRLIAPWRAFNPSGGVIQQIGHQYFPGVVATNEVDDAWMDEGLNTYLTARTIDEAFHWRFASVVRYFGGLIPWTYDDAPWLRGTEGMYLATYRLNPARDSPATPTWRQWPGAVTATSYSRSALWMTSLERLVGDETMRRILRTYYDRNAFRHPTPQEFFAIANEVSGQNLDWFFTAVQGSANTFDYSVDRVTAETNERGAVDSTVVVRRLGDGVFPVDVRVDFRDGASVIERWDGRDPWRALWFRRASPPVRVEIDPDRILTLDVNYTNNSWTADPRAAQAAHKWALRWMTWVEQVLLTYAFFA